MPVTLQEASLAFVELMPQIMRGVALDFFVKEGVTQTQFLVLMAIHSYTQCPMGQLSRALHVSMPTISGVVDRLVHAGLVRRESQPEDRRCVLAELTPKGHRFIRQFHQVVRIRWEEVLRALNPSELEMFHRVMTKLRKEIQK